MLSCSPVQKKLPSTGFLKNLLDYKAKQQSNNSSKVGSISSLQRDVSHLADSFRHKTMQQQIKEKQQIAELRLSEYILQQKVRKHTNEYIQNQRYHVKTYSGDDPFDSVLQILDKYSDFNLNWVSQELSDVSKDRRNQMQQLRQTIQQGLEKGYYEDSIPSTRTSSIKKQIVKDLKHTSTHFFSSEPAGRNDAINLKKWLQNHLESIQENPTIDHKVKLQQASDTLFICLNELIRQVTYQCVERGQLMLAVFKGYVMLFRKTINMTESDKQQIQIMGYKNELELKLEFDDLIDEKDANILKLKEKIKQFEKEIRGLREDEEKQTALIQKLQKQTDVDKTMKKGAATLIQNLNREIKELRNKITKIQYFQPFQYRAQRSEEEEEEIDLSLSQVLKEVEQKTQVEQNPDIVVRDVVEEPPTITYSVYCQTEDNVKSIESQTTLNFMAPHFDKILNQQELEEQYKEYQLKEQMGYFLSDDHVSGNNANAKLQINMQQSQQQRASLMRILDGLPGSIDHVRNMKKEDMFDLFMNNMKTLRELFDKEEQVTEKQVQSDSEQSMLVEPPEVFSDEKRSLTRSNIKLIAEAPELDETSPMPSMSHGHLNFSLKQLSFEKIEPIPIKHNIATSKQLNQVQQKPTKRKIEKMFSSDRLALPLMREQQELALTQNLAPHSLNPPHTGSSILQSSQNLQTTANKFGLTKQEQIQLKTQVSMLIMLYNLQLQKAQNQTKSMNDLASLLNQQFIFTRKLMIHILRTQMQSHKQIAEQFLVDFDALRKRMPVELDAEIQEDEYLNTEFDEEEEKEKKKQIQFKKRKNRITKALQFNFSQKQNKVNLMDKMMHPGIILAVKAKEQSYLFKKIVNYWPVKNVLRTVTQLYDEKIRSTKDNESQKDIEMQIFVFNNFLNKYGFKNVAEKKYLQFLLSVIHFSSIFRVNVFARMIAVLQEEHLNFSVEESQFFLQGYDFMCSESSLGVTVVQSESEQKFHVPYLRALDYMKVYLENKLMEEELRDLKIDLENLKEPDPKNLNKQGLIDVDIFLVKVMQKYRIITTRTKEFVIHAFQAADLDGNKKINNNEFITLYRHIEHQKFNFKEAMNLFDEQADIIAGDERSLSFNRFTSVCVNQQIFTNQSLNNFINVKSNDDAEKQFIIVKQEWDKYKSEIEATLKELQPFVTTEIFTEWNTILKTLEKRLQSNDKQGIKPILIAHKILKLELQRLLHVGHQEDDFDENALIS